MGQCLKRTKNQKSKGWSYRSVRVSMIYNDQKMTTFIVTYRYILSKILRYWFFQICNITVNICVTNPHLSPEHQSARYSSGNGAWNCSRLLYLFFGISSEIFVYNVAYKPDGPGVRFILNVRILYIHVYIHNLLYTFHYK